MAAAENNWTQRDAHARRTPWTACAAVGVGGLAAVVILGWWWGAGLFDDAYIFFRYADNFAAGAGLVYNPGQRVEGFTSPAWMALLVAVRLCTPRLETLAPLLGTVAAAALAPIVWVGLCGERTAASDRVVNALLALGLVSLPCMVFWARSGMETPLFGAVVAAALVAALRNVDGPGVSRWTATFLAMAMVVRPEGALLAGWIGVWATAQRWRFDRAWVRAVVFPLAVAAVPAALVIVARYAYYGELVPNTYVAKVTPDTAARLLRGLRYVGRVGAGHWPLLAVVAVLLAATARARTWSRRPVSLLLGWVLLWIAYLIYVGGDHFSVYRMFVPALPALVLLIGVLWQSLVVNLDEGCFERRGGRPPLVSGSVDSLRSAGSPLWKRVARGDLGNGHSDKSPSIPLFQRGKPQAAPVSEHLSTLSTKERPGGRSVGRQPLFRAAFVGGLALAFGLSTLLALRADGGPARALPRRVAGWGEAGKWVAAHTPADTLIAANVIGAIGYFSHRPLLDLLGLVDPVIARDGTVSSEAAPGHGRYHNDYVFARAPDLVVYPTSGQVPGQAFGWGHMMTEWHYAVVAFSRDPRRAALYEHIAVPLPDGTFVEMDKKRTFPLDVEYLTAPASPGQD